MKKPAKHPDLLPLAKQPRLLPLTIELLEHGGLPKRFRTATSDGDSEVSRFIAEIRDNVARGDGMVLTGPHGTGKSWRAAAIAKAMLRHDSRVRFISADDLVEALKPGARYFDREIFTNLEFLRDRLLLVIDDLGAEYRAANSGFAEMGITNLIRHRVQNCKSTVVTTNLQPEGVEKLYGPGLRSLFNELGSIIQTGGGDQRLRPKQVESENRIRVGKAK